MSTDSRLTRDSIPDDAAALAEVRDRYSQAWRRGPQPTIEDYLPAGGAGRTAALHRLVEVDLCQRLRIGEMACVEAYLGRYPELAEDRAAVLDLIAAEFRQRRERGDVDVAEYVRRFPQYREQLPTRLGETAPAVTAPVTAPVAATPPPSPMAASAPAPAASRPILIEGAEPAGEEASWAGRPERLTDAGLMALFTGGFLSLLCLACALALIRTLSDGQAVARALPVTVAVGAFAALHVWIGRATRSHQLWAVWGGLVAAFLMGTEVLRYLGGVSFRMDGFTGAVCIPLLLLAGLQFFAYLVALGVVARRAPGLSAPQAGEGFR